MIHPHTEIKFISDTVGYGVVATAFIPKGTITWALDKFDREFTPQEFKALDPLYKEILDTYAYKNNKGNLILCWDNGRFVNHSFKSNCLTTAYNFELAIRDIEAGEQLTDDYGYLNVDKPFKGIDEGTERKMVFPDDLLKYHEQWDAQLISAFKTFSKVEQPLKKLLENSTWETALKIEKGEIEMDSILNNYNFNQ